MATFQLVLVEANTIHLPKGNAILGKKLMVDDFRGISISSVLSKIFEHCILDRFSSFLATLDNQFGFKKGLSCSHAIYSVPRRLF